MPPLALFALTRRVPIAIVLHCVIGIVIGFSIQSEYSFGGPSGALTPLVLVIPVATGSTIAVGTGSAAPDVERLAGQRIDRALRTLVAGVSLFAIAITVLAVAWALPDAGYLAMLPIIRSTIFFIGCGLLGCFLTNPAYSWLVPVAMVPMVCYFWISSTGVHYWWNPASPALETPLSWALPLALFVLGFALLGRSLQAPWQRDR